MDNNAIYRVSRALAGSASRHPTLKLLGGGLALATGLRGATAQTNPLVGIPITGALPGGGTFTGTFDVVRFAVQGGQLVAIGDLSGTLRDALGNVIGTVTDVRVRLPVTLQQGETCRILELTLGPLDLDLLGLQVHLDQVHLEITAQPGPGNLLGNLLCAIAGLLDGSDAALGAIARLLNRVLRLLG